MRRNDLLINNPSRKQQLARQSSPRSARKELPKSPRTPSSGSAKTRLSSSVKSFIDNNANNNNNNNRDDGGVSVAAADDSLGIMSPSDMSCLPSLTASMISNFAWEEDDGNLESGGKKKQQSNSKVSKNNINHSLVSTRCPICSWTGFGGLVHPNKSSSSTSNWDTGDTLLFQILSRKTRSKVR